MNRLFNSDDGLKKMYKFSNDCESIVKALGISHERFMVINNIMSQSTREIGSSSKLIEHLANHENLNDCEKMYAIFMYGGYIENLRRICMNKENNSEVIVHEISGASAPDLVKIIDFLCSTSPEETSIEEVKKKIREIMSKNE